MGFQGSLCKEELRRKKNLLGPISIIQIDLQLSNYKFGFCFINQFYLFSYNIPLGYQK